MIFRRVARPAPTGSSAGAWLIATLAAVVLAYDASTWIRLRAFEAGPPPVTRVDARVRFQAMRKRGTVLRVETSNGWIALTTGPSSVFGTTSAGVESALIAQNGVASVAWIDAPASPLHGTVHYPLHVEQAGRVLLQVDGAAAVAAAERADLLPELGIAGAVVVIAATSGLLARRHAR